MCQELSYIVHGEFIQSSDHHALLQCFPLCLSVVIYKMPVSTTVQHTQEWCMLNSHWLGHRLYSKVWTDWNLETSFDDLFQCDCWLGV